MNKQNFQILIYVVFGFFVLVGFGSLALFGLLQKNQQASSSGETPGSARDRARIEIVVWGTLETAIADPILKSAPGGPGRGYDTIRYIQKSPETIESEYTQAVAFDGRVPDILLLESAEVLAFDSRAAVRTIPLGYPPLTTTADYQNLFIPAAHMFLRSSGYIALPIAADSLVLYYNEGLRRQSDLRQLPKVWENFTEKEYQDIAKKYRESGKAIVPFGAYDNYTNAPYLFTALHLQSQETSIPLPTEDLITFYTSFVALRSSVQTWSETFLSARNMFIGNNLLFYPGFISEYKDLQRANPNIVVQVAPLPQLTTDGIATVPTKLYALAIPQKSRNPGPAHQAVFNVAAAIHQVPTELFKATSLPAPINNFDRTTRVALARTQQEAREIEAFFNNSTTADQVFIDTLFSAGSMPLSQTARQSIRNTLKNVIIGTRTTKQGARDIDGLFE